MQYGKGFIVWRRGAAISFKRIQNQRKLGGRQSIIEKSIGPTAHQPDRSSTAEGQQNSKRLKKVVNSEKKNDMKES